MNLKPVLHGRDHRPGGCDPIPGVGPPPLYVPFTPNVTLVKTGGGTNPTQPTTSGWGSVYLPNRVGTETSVTQYDPVFGMFQVTLLTPGAFGSSGTGFYLVTVDDIDGNIGFSVGPDAGLTGYSVVQVGEGQIMPQNFAGSGNRWNANLLAAGGGMQIEVFTQPVAPTVRGTCDPAYPEAWGNSGASTNGIIYGNFMFPAG